MKCDRCGSEQKLLFTSWWCPKCAGEGGESSSVSKAQLEVKQIESFFPLTEAHAGMYVTTRQGHKARIREMRRDGTLSIIDNDSVHAYLVYPWGRRVGHQGDEFDIVGPWKTEPNVRTTLMLNGSRILLNPLEKVMLGSGGFMWIRRCASVTHGVRYTGRLNSKETVTWTDLGKCVDIPIRHRRLGVPMSTWDITQVVDTP